MNPFSTYDSVRDQDYYRHQIEQEEREDRASCDKAEEKREMDQEPEEEKKLTDK